MNQLSTSVLSPVPQNENSGSPTSDLGHSLFQRNCTHQNRSWEHHTHHVHSHNLIRRSSCSQTSHHQLMSLGCPRWLYSMNHYVDKLFWELSRRVSRHYPIRSGGPGRSGVQEFPPELVTTPCNKQDQTISCIDRQRLHKM